MAHEVIAAIQRIRASSFWRREESIQTAWQAIGWWESRRPAFNLIVGCVGVVSCVIAGVVAAASYFLFDSDFGMPDPPLFAIFGIFLYAVMANVCYTGGWIAELGVRAAWPQQADRFAAVTFSIGVMFSVLLTSAPGVLLAAGGAFGLIGHFWGVKHD